MARRPESPSARKSAARRRSKSSGGRKRAATGAAGARAAPQPLTFWSREWAQEALTAWNAGPGDEVKAKKIPRFWEWIEKAKQYVDCQLALAVDGLPGNAKRDCLLLDLEGGRCVRARLATRDDAEGGATYILAGSYQDWREIMSGFDMGKAVMYRKLRLERGEVLEFFKSIYYWTESLACIQRIPTTFPAASGHVN